MKNLHHLFSALVIILFVAACQPVEVEDPDLIYLVADGREITYKINESMTVEEFLRQPGVEVELNATDRLTPPRFTQISNGMRITIVRVTEETKCEQANIPYETQIIRNEGIDPDEERVVQPGENGEQEVCYRIIYEDGIPRSDRNQIGQPTILTAPVDEIIMVGLDRDPDPVAVPGTLVYLNNSNAWIIRENSTTKRPLTTSGNLDGIVMSLSPDGRYLLYTTKPADDEAFVNELWLTATTDNAIPVQLNPTDVLTAEWFPGEANTISYSAGESRNTFPFWHALNNLWLMRIDPLSGETLNIQQVVAENQGGLYGWWGTVYKWSPDGAYLAWTRADSMGIVNQGGEQEALLEYAPFALQDWSWRATISWSFDSELLISTTHGLPPGSQPLESSPVFDATITDVNGILQTNLIDSTGMWAAPQFSPQVDRPESEYSHGYLAYLQAREPFDSINGDYNLIVADRDGSNGRVVFPPSDDQPGINSQILGLTSRDYTWSADGKSLAVIYQGNLWIVNAETRVSHQLSFDEGASYPVWSS